MDEDNQEQPQENQPKVSRKRKASDSTVLAVRKRHRCPFQRHLAFKTQWPSRTRLERQVNACAKGQRELREVIDDLHNEVVLFKTLLYQSAPTMMDPTIMENFNKLMMLRSLPPTYVEGFHDLEDVKSMEYRTLGKTGLIVSKLSLGTGTLGCHYGEFDENEAIETIRKAIKKGINYIDTGYWYGQGKSELILGKALKGIPRQAYYIGTKVGRYELDYGNMFDFSTERIRQSVKQSLERLQLDYVDVIQIHDIEFAPSLDIIITQTLPELSRQVAEGRARHIGITGYPISVLKECIEKSNINIAVVLTYARFTLIDDTLLEYIPFFKEHNIGIINAAAPSMGLLTSQGPPNWHPAADAVKKACKQARDYCQKNDLEFAKLAVWHSFQCPDVATHLIGMQNLREFDINMDVLHNGITEQEKEILKEVKEKYLSKLTTKHWEGIELEKYRNEMKH